MFKKKEEVYQEIDIANMPLWQLCDGGMTLQEVADYMGITKERVRQIEYTAMYKMSKYIMKKRHSDPDFCKIQKQVIMAYNIWGRNKFGNHKVKTSKGVVFDSKAEFDYFGYLCLLEKGKKIHSLARQTPLRLGNDPQCPKYIADFVYYSLQSESWIVCDVKGFATPEFKVKLKWLLDKYDNFIFTIVKNKQEEQFLPYPKIENYPKYDIKDEIEYAIAKYGTRREL